MIRRDRTRKRCAEGGRKSAGGVRGGALALERSVQANPRDPDQRMFLAEAYARLDRKEDALREARRAAEIIPESKTHTSALDC